MDLPNLFTSANPADKYLLALTLTDTTAQAALVKIHEGQLIIVQRSHLHDYQDPKSCVVEVDKCLQELGPESEDVSEVVFGFEPWWVTPTGIQDDRKPLLKQLTQELSLKAVGYVVLTEALAQRLTQQEPLLSTIIIYVAEASLAIAYVKQGKLTKTEVVGRSGETVADVIEALARFKLTANDSYFPSKILLFSTVLSEDELTTEQQALLSFDWPGQQPFLHQPVIEMVAPQELVDAVAEQGSKAVAEAQGVQLAAPAPVAESNNGPESMATDLGFSTVTDEPDLATKVSRADETLANIELVNQDEEFSFDEIVNAQVKSFGVPIGQKHLPTSNQTTEAESDDTDQDATSQPSLSSKVSGFLAQLKTKLPSINSAGGSPETVTQKLSHHPFMIGGFATGLVATVIIALFLFRSTARALVTLEVAAKAINKNVELTVDSSGRAAGSTNLVLAAEKMSKELQGSGSIATTGIKLVGEKAKGSVTLYNQTTSPKTFAAGTTLSAGNLQFTLDSEVTVASASVSKQNGGSETKVYGKTTAAVTAVKIGAESNLAKDTDLKIASFATDTYSAEVAEALTGGASREVRVASEKDRQNLLKKVQEDLTKQAETAFKADETDGRYIIPSGRVTIKNSKFSDEVNAEVEMLSVEVTGAVEGLAYQASDLVPLATAALSDQIPSGYTLSSAQPQILTQPLTPTASGSATRSAQIKLSANVSSHAIPVVSPDEIKSTIKGMPIAQAQSTLNKPEYSNVKVSITPWLSSLLVRSIPNDEVKITVKVTQP
jgi:hypothetical protein